MSVNLNPAEDKDTQVDPEIQKKASMMATLNRLFSWNWQQTKQQTKQNRVVWLLWFGNERESRICEASGSYF